MLFSILIVAIVASLVSSSPLLYKREPGGVLLCTGANSTGTCTHMVAPLSTVGDIKCQQLEKPFFENTATFAPDGEGFECFPRLYSCGEICRSPTGCTFGAVDFQYENKYDLGKISWDKLIRSFDCSLKKEES